MKIKYLILVLLFIFNNHSINSSQITKNTEVISYEEPNIKNVQFSGSQKINNFFYNSYKSGFFNGAYLFSKGDSFITGKFGFKDPNNRDTLTENNLFELASVSKTFTATAIMILHQDGLIDIEDSVHWHLTDLKRYNLTIYHLLTHTSGLPEYFNFSDIHWKNRKEHMQNSDIIAMLNKLNTYYFQDPGLTYDYCNTNFALLAAIVESVSHLSFKTFIQRRIFDVACMNNSTIGRDYNDGNFLWGYVGKNKVLDVPQNGTFGDKGVFSNVVDMFKFDRSLRSPFLLHREIRDKMFKKRVKTNSMNYYSFGWRITTIDNKRWVYHNGWWKGFKTYYWRCLDEDKCFVILTNGGKFLKAREMVKLF